MWHLLGAARSFFFFLFCVQQRPSNFWRAVPQNIITLSLAIKLLLSFVISCTCASGSPAVWIPPVCDHLESFSTLNTLWYYCLTLGSVVSSDKLALKTRVLQCLEDAVLWASSAHHWWLRHCRRWVNTVLLFPQAWSRICFAVLLEG